MIITDTHVYFYNGIYSNWERCNFFDGNESFFSSEQHFMMSKAVFFCDLESISKMSKSKGSSEVKALGRQIKNYNDKHWTCVRFGFMTLANYLKFSQNPELKRELLETGSRIMVECSPEDKIWGIGLDEVNENIYDESKWQGTNLLGKALMEVRDLIK